MDDYCGRNGAEIMKENIYYLYENEKRVAFSYSFEKILNKTIKTENGMIYYNNILVWRQKVCI